jgi:PAS domain S-box-containing protein
MAVLPKGAPVPTSKAIGRTIDRARHTVLVVDDNPSTRYSTARTLRAAGFETKEAITGSEGLALAPLGMSAVVLDVNLPDIDGFEVCGLLRAASETSLLPIIHLSATYVGDAHKVAGLNSGADAYLVHPVEPAVLIATLQALIRARTAEDQLRHSERRFRAIYNYAQSGIALIDFQGRFADVNPALAALLGRPREQLIGHAVSDLAPAEWVEFVKLKTCGIPEGAAPSKDQFPLTRSDGAIVQLDWSMSSHLEPGVHVGIAVDASERLELERRTKEVLEREQAARVVAERHSRTKDDFIAVLSHELRTPLNAITGWVHMLKLREASPEFAKGLEAIDRNAKAQARIISDILDVSRVNSGKLRLERELSDPVELINSAIASLQKSLDDKQLTLEKKFEGASVPAWLDPTRFQQIFWNLLTNAVKFSSAGGVIRIVLEREDEHLTLVVQDFGQGIKAEFIEQLFDRFSQSDAPGNRYHGGLGLGLSIVKHLAEMHGGSVSGESLGLGFGTTMRVTLPVEEGPDDVVDSGPRPSLSKPPEPLGDGLKGLQVLIVEDDADALELVTMVLGDRGATVRTAADFAAALEAVDAAWPDVLVSDIGLPGRDGYDLVREVRYLATQQGKTLQAIALTAFSRTKDQSRAIDAGFDAFISKPLRPHLLIEEIQKLTRRT